MMLALYVLLTFIPIVLLGWASTARGYTLWLVLLLFGWAISELNILIEAVAFGVMPLGDGLTQLGVTLIAFAILAALGVTCVRKWRGQSVPLQPINISWWRIVAAVLLYETLYFGAGTLVWPFVAQFYLAKGLPPKLLVVALQVPRALIFALPALIWLRTRPRYAPVVLGVSFALMGGIAPLLPDNPYMPPAIRMAHAVETGSSNFLFGLLLGWLFGPRKKINENGEGRGGPPDSPAYS